jgi:FlaA1/EpsC-like NDP-sugar epimerase
MTIKEAATLVLHSTKIASGNQVFILDMGKPIKILDLAKRMIKLSGLKERNINDTSGDIEIKITGLRPGEKLHEELALGKNIKQTSILNILEADEDFFEISTIQSIVSNLREVIKENNSSKLKDILVNADIGYKPKIND